MKVILTSTKDTVIGAHMQPITAHNEQDAKRNWGAAITYESMKENPSASLKDLQLWKLGEFDDITGEITADYKFLANAAEFIRERGKDTCSTQKQTDQEE